MAIFGSVRTRLSKSIADKIYGRVKTRVKKSVEAEVVNQVITRTKAGIDLYGKRFKKYSRSYRRLKANAKDRAWMQSNAKGSLTEYKAIKVPNWMRLTGQLMSSIYAEATVRKSGKQTVVCSFEIKVKGQHNRNKVEWIANKTGATRGRPYKTKHGTTRWYSKRSFPKRGYDKPSREFLGLTIGKEARRKKEDKAIIEAIRKALR